VGYWYGGGNRGKRDFSSDGSSFSSSSYTTEDDEDEESFSSYEGEDEGVTKEEKYWTVLSEKEFSGVPAAYLPFGKKPLKLEIANPVFPTTVDDMYEEDYLADKRSGDMGYMGYPSSIHGIEYVDKEAASNYQRLFQKRNTITKDVWALLQLQKIAQNEDELAEERGIIALKPINVFRTDCGEQTLVNIKRTMMHLNDKLKRRIFNHRLKKVIATRTERADDLPQITMSHKAGIIFLGNGNLSMRLGLPHVMPSPPLQRYIVGGKNRNINYDDENNNNNSNHLRRYGENEEHNEESNYDKEKEEEEFLSNGRIFEHEQMVPICTIRSHPEVSSDYWRVSCHYPSKLKTRGK
jgi:hypothetical protein